MPRSPDSSNASRLIMLAMVVLVVAILYVAHAILVPLALAILFTFLLTPIVSRLEQWQVHRAPAVIGVVLICVLIIAAIGWVVGGQVSNLADNLDRYRGNIDHKILSLKPHNLSWIKFTRIANEFQEKLETPTTQSTQPTTTPAEVLPATNPTFTQEQTPVPVSVVQTKSEPLQIMEHDLGLALGPLATAGIVVVFVIFILLKREDLRDRIIKLVAHGSLTVTTQALDDAAARISRYIFMQSIVNLCFGFCMGLGFYLIGIPNSFLWGLLCAILRFIPYVGTWIAACFPLGLSLAVFQDNWHFIYTAIFYVLSEMILFNFIEPWVYGSSTGMSEVAVLLAAVFWAWLWGPIGLLLSTPLTTILVVIGKHVPQLQFLDTLLGDSPVLDPCMRYYQRLLAMDENESGSLVEEYLEKMPLENVYDSVVIPALALAEEDRRHGQLNEARQKFISDAVTAQIEFLGQRRLELEEESRQPKESELKKVIENIPIFGGEKTGQPADQKFHPTPITGSPDIRILCLPARSDFDALIARMIAQCLEIRGFSASFADATVLASEMVQRVATDSIHIVAISALPPSAVRHARYLCKRLHAPGPDLPIAIGIWDPHIDPKITKRRIAAERSVHVSTTLCDLITTIEQLAKSLPTPTP